MQNGRFNIVTDGQWGSCGKGLITTALADRYRPDLISTTNMANAGHTAVWNDGRKFIAKALPSASALTKWTKDSEPYNPYIVLGPSCAFHLDRLLEEIAECEITNLIIHDRAGVITDDHRIRETDLESGTKHIASTMQGCGAFLADKVMRRKDLRLARDYPELQQYSVSKDHNELRDLSEDNAFPIVLDNLMRNGKTMLHEGSQGFSLDINHGSHYPQCTSRGTTSTQYVADMGIRPQAIGDIYLVIRPFPIRVGNVTDGDKVVGYSGDAYPGQSELSWQEVAIRANAPKEIADNELTTVTKRLRRVFEFSDQQLREAAVVNGATKIALNFANYIDWSCYGENDYDNLPTKVTDFIAKCEDVAGIPVTIVGTGPQNNHVCFVS